MQITEEIVKVASESYKHGNSLKETAEVVNNHQSETGGIQCLGCVA